jgi:ABC-type multidrug transport system permease subunit
MMSHHLIPHTDIDGISLVLLVFMVLCMVVYCWSLWSFAWWLEVQHLRLVSWHMLDYIGQL